MIEYLINYAKFSLLLLPAIILAVYIFKNKKNSGALYALVIALLLPVIMVSLAEWLLVSQFRGGHASIATIVLAGISLALQWLLFIGNALLLSFKKYKTSAVFTGIVIVGFYMLLALK